MTNPTLQHLQQLADEALETGMLVITERNTLRARVAELEAERANAGWLAQMIIDKLGGTNDLPSWVQQSAKYYRRCQDELRQANAKIAELEARLAAPSSEINEGAVRKDVQAR